MFPLQGSTSCITSSQNTTEKKTAVKVSLENEEQKKRQERETCTERIKSTFNETGNNVRIHTPGTQEVKRKETAEEGVLWLVSPRLRLISSTLSPGKRNSLGWRERERAKKGYHNPLPTSSVSHSTRPSDHDPFPSFRAFDGISIPRDWKFQKDSCSPLQGPWRGESKPHRSMRECTAHAKWRNERGGGRNWGGCAPWQSAPEREAVTEGKRLFSFPKGEAEVRTDEMQKRGKHTVENSETREEPFSPPFSCVPRYSLPIVSSEFSQEEEEEEKEGGKGLKELVGAAFEMDPRGEGGVKRVEHASRHDEDEREGVVASTCDGVEDASYCRTCEDPSSSLGSTGERGNRHRNEYRKKDKEREMITEEAALHRGTRKGNTSHSSTFSASASGDALSRVPLSSSDFLFSPFPFSFSVASLLKQIDEELEENLQEPGVEEEAEIRIEKEREDEEGGTVEFPREEGVDSFSLISSAIPSSGLAQKVEGTLSVGCFASNTSLCGPPHTTHSHCPSPCFPSLSSSRRPEDHSNVLSSRSPVQIEKKNNFKMNLEAKDMEQLRTLEKREGIATPGLRNGCCSNTPKISLEGNEEGGGFKPDDKEEKNIGNDRIHSFLFESPSPPCLSLTLPLVTSPPGPGSSSSRTAGMLGSSPLSNTRDGKSSIEDELRTKVCELFTLLHLFFS